MKGSSGWTDKLASTWDFMTEKDLSEIFNHNARIPVNERMIDTRGRDREIKENTEAANGVNVDATLTRAHLVPQVVVKVHYLLHESRNHKLYNKLVAPKAIKKRKRAANLNEIRAGRIQHFEELDIAFVLFIRRIDSKRT